MPFFLLFPPFMARQKVPYFLSPQHLILFFGKIKQLFSLSGGIVMTLLCVKVLLVSGFIDFI